MQTFMDKDFLLSNGTAQKLYHEAAAEEPIYDYHCHLIPKEIAENRRFDNLAQVWLGENGFGDHYKWRMLRANGVEEKLITGTGADPYERFMAWADTVPKMIGNPLYHWTHLELQRYFDIHEPLNRESAPAIWKTANEKLQYDPNLSVYGIFKKFKVFGVGTTDDPSDNLEWHEKITRVKETETLVLPSFRPDRVLNIEKEGFSDYITALGKSAGKAISSLSDLLDVLKARVDHFDKNGCRASDHGLEYVPFETASDGSIGSLWEKEVNKTFTAVIKKAGSASGSKTAAAIGKKNADAYKTYILRYLGGLYAEKGWAMQIHIAAIRNNNSRKFQSIGADTGYDAVHDHSVAANISALLDIMEKEDRLPKTVLYSLNFSDFYPLATIMGCFQGSVRGKPFPGKMQLGSAWWHLDHRDGMEDQMKLLGNVGLLSHFIGMLTDSRSFLSYPRHEYFRRILCNIIGSWAEAGEIPNDFNLLSGMVKDISFRNVKNYLA